MRKSISLVDPMGNTVWFPMSINSLSKRKYKAISAVITAPAFIIKEKNKALYFFRLITANTNFLIEVRLIKNEFVVNACMENPSAEYVSVLLKKGHLYSFR
jgi:hypothetical protein